MNKKIIIGFLFLHCFQFVNAQKVKIKELFDFVYDYKKFELKMLSMGMTCTEKTYNPTYHTLLADSSVHNMTVEPTNDSSLINNDNYSYFEEKILQCKYENEGDITFSSDYDDIEKTGTSFYTSSYYMEECLIGDCNYDFGIGEIVYSSRRFQIIIYDEFEFNQFLNDIINTCEYVETRQSKEKKGGYESIYKYDSFKITVYKYYGEEQFVGNIIIGG